MFPGDDVGFVQEVARFLYGRTPCVHRLRSHNNDVYLLDFGGDLPDMVIKFAATDSASESREGLET